MEAVILIGIPGSGKSTFCRERFFQSHVRINLDMLKTRHREQLLLQACLQAKQPFVVDNTNATVAERGKYIEAARQNGFRVIGYYFRSRISDCLQRNAGRPSDDRIPEVGVWGTAGRLELPRIQEGFDDLHYVWIDEVGAFHIEPWQEETGTSI